MFVCCVCRQSGSDKAWKGAAASDTVHDMVLDSTGSYLYSATSASSSVKIWDLRKSVFSVVFLSVCLSVCNF